MKISYDWEYLLQTYREFVKKSSEVLEVGASNVERTREIASYCEKLLGVELSEERRPKDFENVKYLTGDWEKLTKVVGRGRFDVAVASHVIEHVPNDLKAMNELFSVLKKGGAAIINTPNRKRLTRVILDKLFGERIFPYLEHRREYTEEDLINLLNRSKFKNFQIEPVVFGLHGGPVFLYFKKVPTFFRKYANFWQIVLIKE